MKITEDIIYIGADDKTIDLFEGQYVVPNGISYNSYLIKDEKNVIMDTIDKRKSKEWLDNLENALENKEPDYLVVSHMEPDHAYNIGEIASKYPKMKIIGNQKTFVMLQQFFNIPNLEQRKIEVKEGEELNIGKHTLQFFMAPMVHWPEVMVTYEKTEKIVFSADGFGKYGAPVQALLKKLSTLDVKMICPLHGPILKENLGYYIDKYNTWSSYKPEEEGIFIAYASIYGNTAKVAEKLAEILNKKEQKK